MMFISWSSALEIHFQALILSAWPTSAHTSALQRHAPQLAPWLRPSAAVAKAARGTSILLGQSQQNTPLKHTALPTDTIEVTDPTHPLYGLTFPLMGITTKPRLGRVCVVWLYPGIERIIPFAATSLSETPAPPSRCRLCIEGLQSLLAVVATWDAHPPQEADVD